MNSIGYDFHLKKKKDFLVKNCISVTPDGAGTFIGINKHSPRKDYKDSTVCGAVCVTF